MSTTIPRRQFVLRLAALAAAPLAVSPLARAIAADRASAAPSSAHWSGYAKSIVIDALGGPGDSAAKDDAPLSASALDDVRLSGLTAANVTVSGVGSYTRDYDATIRNIAYWDAQIAANPEHLLLVRSAADIDAAKSSQRLGLIYGFQDATPLAEDLDRVELFRQLGVRVFQLTYNRRNLVGDGCLEPGNAGLSAFGHALIERLDASHSLIDLSHSGQRTTLEAIAAAKGPIAITHTGCAALANLPRNKTDEELRKVADKGGIAGIYLMPFLRAEGQPMAEDVLRHIEHAVDVSGENHVGIGTDGVISPVAFTDEYRRKFAEEVAERRRRGISAPGERPDVFTFVPDFNSADRFDRIAVLMHQRGHSDARIAKVLGGNFQRLFREVWQA